MSTYLRSVLDGGRRRPEVWDANTRQQLKWAISNANGNINLNSASSYFVPPHFADTPGELRDIEQRRKDSLHKALNAFQDL